MSTIPEDNNELGSLIISGEEDKDQIDQEQGTVSLDKLKAMQELGISEADLAMLQQSAFKVGKRGLRAGLSNRDELSPKQLAKKKRLRKLQKEARRKNRNKNKKKGMRSGKGSQVRGKR